jgi:hypothetical protein
MGSETQAGLSEEQILLYKFYPPSTLIALKNQTLAFTPPKWFNDPFEFLPRIIRDERSEKMLKNIGNFTKKEAERYRRVVLREHQLHYSKSEFMKFLKQNQTYLQNQAPKEFDTYSQDIAIKLLNILSGSIGVLCLSKSWTNPLMWSHYSAGFQGFCVGYKLPSNSKALPKLEVAYSDERFPLNETEVLKNRITPELVDGIIARKSLHWKYEEEVRYIISLSHPKLESNADSSQFYLKHESLAVQEILLGLRCSQHMRAELCALARKSYPHAMIYNTSPDTRDFDICRSLIHQPML